MIRGPWSILAVAAAMASVPWWPVVAVVAAFCLLWGFAIGISEGAQGWAASSLVLSTVAVATVLYALALPAAPSLDVLGLQLGAGGASLGFEAGLRLSVFLLVPWAGRHVVSGADFVLWASRWPMVGYLAGSVLRLGPALSLEMRRIQEAQRARGLTPVGASGRVRWLRSITVPLFVAAMRTATGQARALALARAARGQHR